MEEKKDVDWLLEHSIADCFRDGGANLSAISFYLRSLAHGSSSEWSYRSCALVFRSIGNYERAIHICSEGLRKIPGNEALRMLYRELVFHTYDVELRTAKRNVGSSLMRMSAKI